MKRLFISLLLLLAPLALIRGEAVNRDGRSYEEESHEAELKKMNAYLKAQKLVELNKKSLEEKAAKKRREQFERSMTEREKKVAKEAAIRRKEFLENYYRLHRATLDHAIVLDDSLKRRNVDCHRRRNKYLEEIAPEVIKDIDCDPNNEAIILNIFCMDPEETGNDSDEVKNEKVSTCKANFIKILNECRERIEKTKEVNQEK